MQKQIDVFISSTCYDLADLRAELAADLVHRGFAVRLSEDPNSGFAVEPTDDSIASCLLNVEASDAVVCIVDRRYGGVLKHGAFEGKSATHAEVLTARKLHKPIFYFVRERAWNDYHSMRAESTYEPKWVDRKHSKEWLAFIKAIAELPEHTSRSNWCDPFKTSVDLRSLVQKRLLDQFPQMGAALAMHPDRMVRMYIAAKGCSGGEMDFEFRNVGPGPALNVEHGFGIGAAGAAMGVPEKIFRVGGLCVGDHLRNNENGMLHYAFGNDWLRKTGAMKIFCRYENRFGDKYSIEMGIPVQNGAAAWQGNEPEELFVWQGENELGRWVRIR